MNGQRPAAAEFRLHIDGASISKAIVGHAVEVVNAAFARFGQFLAYAAEPAAAAAATVLVAARRHLAKLIRLALVVVVTLGLEEKTLDTRSKKAAAQRRQQRNA